MHRVSRSDALLGVAGVQDAVWPELWRHVSVFQDSRRVGLEELGREFSILGRGEHKTGHQAYSKRRGSYKFTNRIRYLVVFRHISYKFGKAFLVGCLC